MLFSLIKYDTMFQIRQGFYLIYAILTAIYLLILFYLPHSVRMEVTAYLILSDTSVMGLLFVGALVLLEKQQNVLQSLFVTPLKLDNYLWSKSLSLTLIALVVSSAIGFLPGGMLGNWLATLIAVALSSLFFTFVGLGISARVNTLNQYLAGILLGGLVMVAPIALFFFTPILSLVFPINAAIDLLILTPEVQTPKGIVADTAVLVCWNILAFIYARSQFMKHVICK
jgi:fluoroquinolone transport system permease protein